MIDKNDVIPIDAFFNEDYGPNPACDPRKIIGEADFIVAVDYMTGTVYRVYGKELAEEILRTGKEGMGHLLAIGVDKETDDTEKLVALITAIKGRWDP